jgi:hypothetical protein
MDQAQRNSSIVYPKLAAPLMDEDLRLLFTTDGAGFANHVCDRLVCAAEQLDREVSLVRSVRLDGTHRRPVLARMSRVELPDSAAEVARQVIDEMPERSVLEALSNTAQPMAADWGLPKRRANSPGMSDLARTFDEGDIDAVAAYLNAAQ